MIEIVNKIHYFDNLPIFAHENYLKTKSKEYGWFKNDKFLLPFIIDQHFIFRRLIFTTEIIYLNNKTSLEEEKNFLNEIVDYCKKNKICDFIYKPQANAVFNIFPNNSLNAEWGTYEIDLRNKSIDEIFNNFHSKHKNVIRKAIKSEVKIKQLDDIEIVYQNIKETFERQKSLYYPSLDYLKKLKDNLQDNLLIIGSFYQDKLQGCAVIPYSKERAYYLYGGSIQRPFTGSLNYMHYEIIKFLKEKEVKYYDFMGARLCLEKGSKFEGIQRFKSRFGARLKKGYAFIVPINNIKYKLFIFLVKNYFRFKGTFFEEPIVNLRKCDENSNNIRL